MPLMTCQNPECHERIARYPCAFCGFDPKKAEKEAEARDKATGGEGVSKKFPWMLIVGGAVLVSSTGIFGSFSNIIKKSAHVSDPKVQTAPPQLPSDMVIDDTPIADAPKYDADQIWSDYAINAALADEKYKGKTTAVLGRVVHIDTRPDKNMMRLSYSDTKGHEIVAVVRDADKTKLADVVVDDLVILVCNPIGLVEGVPVLDNCTLVR